MTEIIICTLLVLLFFALSAVKYYAGRAKAWEDCAALLQERLAKHERDALSGKPEMPIRFFPSAAEVARRYRFGQISEALQDEAVCQETGL